MSRRSCFFSLGALGLLTLSLLACRGDGAPAVLVDLIELFPLAEVEVETRGIDFASPAAGSHLGQGWAEVAETTDGTGTESYRWSVGDHSQVRLTLARPRHLTLRFRCWPLGFKDAPQQTVTLEANDRKVGEVRLEAGPQDYEIPIPASRLVAGENRFAFRYAFNRRPSEIFAGSDDTRSLAVAWSWLRIKSPRFYGLPQIETSQTDSSLILPFYSATHYYLRAPAKSFLLLDALRPWGSWSQDHEQAVVEVTVESTVGVAERVVLAFSSRSKPKEIPLPGAQGGPIRISLRAWPGADLQPGQRGLALVAPRLRAPAAAKSPPAAVPARQPVETQAEKDPTEALRRPNVVIYLVDSLRADHLGCYGYSKPTSPHIDAFARDATKFNTAIAQSSWTRTAVASLFTGLNAGSHGSTGLTTTLAESLTLLPETFQELGYLTLAAVTNGNVSEPFGFTRGFHTYEQLREDWSSEVHRQSDRVNELVFPWLENMPQDRPFLLYVHTTDPHAPYAPREPYRQRFAPQVKDRKTGTLTQLLAGEKERSSQAPREDLMALYDAEIAFNDASFGSFLEKLKELGLYESSLIVFLSDHGEAFDEHGFWQHGHSLFSEEVTVPLIVKLPHGEGRGAEVTQIARQVDVLPTLLDYLGAETTGEVQGRSLLPLIPLIGHSQDGESEPPTFSHHVTRLRQLASVIVQDRKLIRSYYPYSGRLELELYDLAQDPAEKNNRVQEDPIWAGYLLSLLKLSRPLASPGEAEIDDALRETLQGLGYFD